MPEAHDPYDQVPYPSLPSRRTHIAHLAAIGRLLALDPPAPRTARVLELGCAAGGNLMPMAGDFPKAQFVGIDLSARQIEAGREAVQELGYKNLELKQADLLALDLAELGAFDYILCHGVYSWVPRAVQDKILALGRACLAPRGMMFVSFNAYPGWHLRGMVREMLTYHVASFDKPTDKIQQARALLDTLIKSAVPRTEVFRQVLREEADILKEMGDAYLFHEHLESVNEPLYFHQFAARVEAAGLQYLGDTDFGSMLASNVGEDVARMMQGAPVLKAEQYLDFFQCRTFRGSLLAQPEAVLDRQVVPERLMSCSVGLEERLEFAAGAEGALLARMRDQTISIRHPLVIAALRLLQDLYPSWIPFDELVLEAGSRVGLTGGGREGAAAPQQLAADLLILYVKRVVRLWAEAPPCTGTPGPRPQTTVLARWQAAQKMTVTNLRHERVRLSPPELFLLAAMDGSLDRAALRDRLAAAVKRREFEVREEGRVLEHPEPRHLDELLTHLLASLGQNGLLIA